MKTKSLLAILTLGVCFGCTSPQAEKAAVTEKTAAASEQAQTEKVLPSEFKPLSTPLRKDKFIQINIVVDDIYRAAKAWAALLDIPVPEVTVNHLESNGEYPYSYRGEENTCDLLVCNIDMGSWVLELHQADEKASSFREFYDKHGNGVHHIGFEVIRELKGLGFDTERTIGVYPGSSWSIVDSEDVLGVNLNIKPKR